MKPGELPSHAKRITETKIDESGAYMHQYKEHSKFLNQELQKIDESEVLKLEQLAKKTEEAMIISSYPDDQKKAKLYLNLAATLGRIRYLIRVVKTQGSLPESVLEDLAKNQIFQIADASSINDSRFEKIANILHHLAKSIESLSQGKFPEDYKRQVEKRSEGTKDEIDRRREELKKINII